MKYKGIIMDLDDTIYDYRKAHKHAYEGTIEYAGNLLKKDREYIEWAFKKGREKTHMELKGRASSHNRLLYFQKMLELLKMNPMYYALEVYDFYWGKFLEHMEIFDGIEELLEYTRGNNIKTCILTNLTSHIQFRKIKKLHLEKYIDYLVTSEEVGVEKPNPKMFHKALNKLKLSKKEVAMIGDDYEIDILGGLNVGIAVFWLNHLKKQQVELKGITEIKSTKFLKEALW